MEALSNYMNPQQTADFFGISLSYLYKLTSKKKIPFYKPFGNRIYFDAEELKTFLKGTRIATEEEQTKRAIKHTILK